jgi:tRNA 2-thiocytidine biosynthesis protein TtcA
MLDTLQRWNMLEGVKRLGIGVSGGADSLAMMEALFLLNAKGRISGVQLIPVFIDQYLDVTKQDRLRLYLQQSYGLELSCIVADTRTVAASLVNSGKAPCRGCAPIRAEAFGRAASELALDAIALGHHLVDAMATLLMNIFHSGKIETMRPIAWRRRSGGIPIIRPFFFTDERVVKLSSPVGEAGLFNCDVCTVHSTERERARSFVESTFSQHPVTTQFAATALEHILQTTPTPHSRTGRAS